MSKKAESALYPYPASLNIHAAMDVAGFFRGTVKVGHAVHAAWELLGYAVSQVVPDPGEEGRKYVARSRLPSGEEAAKLFDKLANKPDGMKAIDWKNLIALLMQIIAQFLKTPVPSERNLK